MNENTQQVHHEFSPSTLPAIKECAHFQSGNSDKDFDSIGTLMHSYCEALVLGNEPVKEGLSEDQIIACEKAVESMKFLIESKYGKVLEVKTEFRVELVTTGGKVFSHGYQDLYLKCENGECGLDWKACFDFNIDKVDYSAQQEAYGLAHCQKHGKTDIDWFEWYIMPNKFKQYTINATESITKIMALKQKRDNRNNYEKNINYFCRFCAQFKDCPKVQELAAPVLPIKNLPLDVDFSKITDPQIIENYVILKKNFISPAMSKLKSIDEKIKKVAIEYLKKAPLQNVKLQEIHKKTVKDTVALFEAVKHLVSRDEFLGIVKASLTDIIKIVYKNKKALDKKYTQKKAKEEVYGLVASLINDSVYYVLQ